MLSQGNIRLRTGALKTIDAITLSVGSALTLGALTANVLLRLPPLLIVLPLVGAAAYGALVLLGRFDSRITCDYIQSGEAAVGSCALFAALTFSSDRLVVTAALFTALLLYDAYLSATLAPDKKEHSVNGALVMAAAAAVFVFLAANGPGGKIASLAGTLLGRLPAAWNGQAFSAAAIALVMLLSAVIRLAGPELRMYSQGAPFYSGSGAARAGIAIFTIAARTLLVSMAILFAGIACGIGVSLARLYRGSFPVAAATLACACFAEVNVTVAALAGPWHAVALSVVGSYIMFALYYTTRTQLYDRHQKY